MNSGNQSMVIMSQPQWERKELIKASRDSWYSVAQAHTEYFRSLQTVENELGNFLREAFVICWNSPSVCIDHQTLEEVHLSKDSSLASDDGGGDDDDVLSVYGYVHGGSDSSKISSGELNSEEHSGETSQQDITTSILENGSSDGSMNLYPGRFHFPQFGNEQYIPSYGFEFPHGNSISIGDSADGMPCKSAVANYESWESNHRIDLPLNLFLNSRFNPDANWESFGWQMDYPAMVDFQSTNPMYYHTYNHVVPQSNPPYSNMSTWNYLSPFNSFQNALPDLYFEGSYNPYFETNGMDVCEVREREGIPDLEDEVDDPVVAVVSGEDCIESNQDNKCRSEDVSEDEAQFNNSCEGQTNIQNHIEDRVKNKDFESRSRLYSSETSKLEKIENLKSYDAEECMQQGMETPETHEILDVSTQIDGAETNGDSNKLSTHTSGNQQDILNELKNSFDSIILCGKDVSEMLEPYCPDITLIKESSGGSTSSALWMCKRKGDRKQKMGNLDLEDCEKHTRMTSCSLSLTLEKLYILENNLYKEVKDKEKLGKNFDQELRKLKKLDEKGAESSKLASSQFSLTTIAPRISVAITKVEGFARETEKIRDEELQPLFCELIQRLHKMWKSSFESHKKQVQGIMMTQANVEMHCVCSDSSLKAAIKIEAEILKLETVFVNWIQSFKEFPALLKRWLMKCLKNDQGEIPDHSSSSSGLLLPPIIVICNDWVDAVDNVSSNNVSHAFNNFASLLHLFRENLLEERHQKLRIECLLRCHEKKLKKFAMENGSDREQTSLLGEADLTATITGNSSLDALHSNLRPFRSKLYEATTKHEDVMNRLSGASLEILQDGFVPVLEALERFSLEMSNALEHVRIPK